MSPPDFGNAAYLLIQALKATDAAVHPPRPFHGGGPQPRLDAYAYVLAALWIAERARPYAAPGDRDDFDRWVALARRQLELGAGDMSQFAALQGARAAGVRRVPLKCAVWAAHEAGNFAHRPIYAGNGARPAAGKLARHLLDTDGADAARAYLAEVDALCVRLEAGVNLRERKLAPSAAVARVVWRGHAKSKATHWLLALASGRFALLHKVGARWALVEGDRDHVLASVTGDQFAAAVAAALRPPPCGT